MARFRAWIEGRFGNQASRMGDDGILAEATTETAGVYVVGRVTEQGEEEFQIFATRGRRTALEPLLLGTVQATEAGGVIFRPERSHTGRKLVDG